MIVLVVGPPMAGLVAGRTAYESSMRTVQAQSAERQQVSARVMSITENVGQPVKEQAQARVRWTDSSGTVRTATALVEPDTSKGATVRVWVDRDGTVTSPPLTKPQAVPNGWFVGGMAVISAATGPYRSVPS
ncbi:Rv1733c family protein [Streptomyces pratens]